MTAPEHFAWNARNPRADGLRRDGLWLDVTLGELARRRAHETPNRCAIVDGAEFTFSRLYSDASRLASAPAEDWRTAALLKDRTR